MFRVPAERKLPNEVIDAHKVIVNYLGESGNQWVAINFLGMLKIYKGDDEQVYTPIALDVMRFPGHLPAT